MKTYTSRTPVHHSSACNFFDFFHLTGSGARLRELADVVLVSWTRQISEDVSTVNALGQLGDLGRDVRDVAELILGVGLRQLKYKNLASLNS